MDYNTVINTVTQILLVSGLISLAVSVVTEFLIKKLFSMTTQCLNVVVTVFSMALTVIVALAYFQINDYAVMWYTWLAVLFVGFLVACISMNGYDKIFSYIYTWIKGIFGANESEVE